MNIEKLHKNVHFIGIGGISMSAIAHILLSNGVVVSGSDRSDSAIIDILRGSGVEIFIGHSCENIKNPDLVVYTAAISHDNPEFLAAKERGIPMMERAEFLGQLMTEYEMPIAVSGTHGKTTTTSMLSCTLLYADLDPTVLVGGELSQINGNYHLGSKKHMVFEACEYVDSFLHFNPYCAIVLNVEADHLDYFSGLEQIKQSFGKFATRIPENGFIVLNADDENVMDSAKEAKCRKILYGEKGDYRAENITFDESGFGRFTLVFNGERTDVHLGVRGTHNVSNALAVFATAHNLGLEPDIIAKGIGSFTGTVRRFEYKGDVGGAKVYDDYAHHPTEVKVTLDAAKNIPHNRVWCVFQPHTYTRTKALMDDFAATLSFADKVIVTDIYAAREPNDGVTHSSHLVEKIDGARYISDFNEIAEYIKKNIAENDIVITMGAGSITQLSHILVS